MSTFVVKKIIVKIARKIDGDSIIILILARNHLLSRGRWVKIKLIMRANEDLNF
jgi:hypothetical protein